MTTRRQRRLGRALRGADRIGFPREWQRVIHRSDEFNRALADVVNGAVRAFDAMGKPHSSHPRPILHNGKAPR